MSFYTRQIRQKLHTNTVFVNDLNDFPESNNNVIKLKANTSYVINNDIDLQGNRLICLGNCALVGNSKFVNILRSTGLAIDMSLINSNYSIEIINLSLYVPDIDRNILNLDASLNPNQTCIMNNVFFQQGTAGMISGYLNVLCNLDEINCEDGLYFDKTFSSIVIETSKISPISNSGIILMSTVVINTRLRMSDSVVMVGGGTTGISVDNLASVPIEGFILNNVNFSGVGTYLNGIDNLDDEALMVNCIGIDNSISASHYHMQNNVTLTDIVTQSIFVKISGTTSQGSINSKFILSNNRATYDGARIKFFKINVIASISTGVSKEIAIRIAKNGITISNSESTVSTDSGGNFANISCQSIIELQTDDYIEIWIANNSDTTDITVSDLNVIIYE